MSFSDQGTRATIEDVPSLGGAVAAMLLGWMVDDTLQPLLGTGFTLLVSFVVTTVAFFVVRQWLKQLRDG